MKNAGNKTQYHSSLDELEVVLPLSLPVGKFFYLEYKYSDASII